jgi:hypothetical protein
MYNEMRRDVQMPNPTLDLAVERLRQVKELVVEAGVSPNGGIVRDADALLRQLVLFAEVSTKRAA